jgi:curli production assembly/transport component CsgG
MKQFSTAANTGATSILIKRLKIQNGLCQLSVKILVIYFRKNLIRSTRQNTADPSVPQITPIIYGILLEGGIVSYDSNIMGGFGGLGILGRELSSRQGQVTIYQYGIFKCKW